MLRPSAVVLLVATLAAPARADPWTSHLTGPSAAARLTASTAQGRREAARVLGQHGDADRAVAALVQALPGERDASVATAIARALARRGHEAAVPALVHALRSGDGAGRAAVAVALAELGTGAAIRALVEGLADPQIAPASRAALERVGARAAPHLLPVVREPSTDEEAAEGAARLLGKAGDPAAAPALVAASRAPHASLRRAAVEALGALGDTRAVPAVVARVGDDEEAVSLAALGALAELAGPTEAPLLARLASEGAPRVRQRALEALVRADPFEAADPLAAAIGADSPVGPAARRALLNRPHAAFLPILSERLGEGDPAAADALAEVQGGQGLAALARAARRPLDGEVRRAVGRSLAVALRRWPSADAPARAEAVAALRDLTDDGARGWALRAVAGLTEASEAARAGLRSRSVERRRAAARALALLGRAEHAGVVAEALRTERDPDTFRALAHAARVLDARSEPGPLWPWLRRVDAAPEAMVLAARSLESASPRERRRLRRLLRRRLRSPEPRVRAGAAWALAEARDRQAWRALVERLDDSTTEVRHAAARSLAVLAVQDAVPAVQSRARVEEDPWVRQALHDAAGAPSGRPLRAFAARGDEVLRLRVATSRVHEPLSIDVVLPDGRWVRLDTLSTGEAFLTDVPAGTADVRVLVGG